MILNFHNGISVSMIETTNPEKTEIWPFVRRENSGRFYLWKTPGVVFTENLPRILTRLSGYTDREVALEVEACYWD